jgi:hypothetical protein
MATTTPNFGWPVPTSTDLVKDGAVAIESLGDAIDASLLDLKGGTTGQVLAKATNTDMDFTWVAQDDSNAIQNAIVDAKGDLIAATAADTPARLAVGANDTVLTADSSTATGLKWATPSGGSGMTLLASGSLSGSTLTISSISQSYINLQLFIDNVVCSLTNESVKIQVNGTGNNNFYCVSLNQLILATSAANQDLYLTSGNLTNAQSATFNIYNYTSAYAKQIFSEGFTVSAAVKLQQWGAISGTGAITSLTIFPSGGTFTGNYKLYGVK